MPLSKSRHRIAAALLGMAMSYSGAQAQAPDHTPEWEGPGLRAPQWVNQHPLTLPPIDLTGDLLFQILASEIAAQRGMFDLASDVSADLARYTRDPRLARRALEFSLAGGHRERALESAGLWADIDPADQEAEQTYLSLTAAQGHLRGLGRLLRARVAEADNKAVAILRVRQVLAGVEDPARRLALMEEALQDVQNLPEARLAIVREHAAAGQLPKAYTLVQAAQRQWPDSESVAMLALQIGVEIEPDQAIAGARAFAVQHPRARNHRVLLARALATIGEMGDARATLDKLSDDYPEDFELLYLKGLLAYQDKRVDDANRYLAQYLEISEQQAATGPELPETANALMLRVQIAEEGGKFDEAYELLDQVQVPPLDFEARLKQAAIRNQQGRLQEALNVLQDIDPRTEEEGVQLALAQARLLTVNGQKEEALRVLEDADRNFPDSPDLMYDLAMRYEQANKLPQMEAMLRQVIAVNPEQAHAYNALGYSLADRGLRLDEARRLIQKALSLRPNDPFILDSMGWVLYRQGELADAERYLKQAYALRPDVEIAVHLGEVLWERGKQAEARELWRTAAQKEPDSRLLNETLQRLKVTP
ncbi:MAG: tetratricopeptide repeat protein [Pigmentiphaga sp.]|nr:tetratricopeptide repeat protein [Pigmentiphaga sp.]